MQTCSCTTTTQTTTPTDKENEEDGRFGERMDFFCGIGGSVGI